MTVTNLNILQSGTLASVTPLNENFETLRVAVNTVEQANSTTRTYLDSKVTEINGTISSTAKSLKTVGEVFCINSGSFDVNDNPAILSISGTTLSLVTPFVGTNINGDVLEATTISDTSILGLADGTYNVFVDLEGGVDVLKNAIFRQDTEPTATTNDIWVNTSRSPITAKIYTNDGWSDFLKIPVGSFVVSEGSADSVKTNNYNQNGYYINSSSLFPMPDYTKGVNKTNGTTYTADVSGWIYAYGQHQTSGSSSLTIDGTTLNVASATFTGTYYISAAATVFPVAKGSIYKGAGLNKFIFFPIKSV